MPASIGIATLSWWGGLRAPVTLGALAGVLYSWQGYPCQTVRRVGARSHWPSRLEVGQRADNPLPVKKEKKELLQKPERPYVPRGTKRHRINLFGLKYTLYPLLFFMFVTAVCILFC